MMSNAVMREGKLRVLLNSLALKPLRICRYLNHCVLCDQDITAGQSYRDGGYARRAHESCFKTAAEAQTAAKVERMYWLVQQGRLERSH